MDSHGRHPHNQLAMPSRSSISRLAAGTLAGLVGLIALPVATAAAQSKVVVQLQPGASVTDAAAIVRAAGGRITHDLPIVNGFAASVPKPDVATVAGLPGVVAVTPDRQLRPQ